MNKTTIGTKDQANSAPSRRQFQSVQLAVLFMTICLTSAVSSAGTSRLYPPSKDESGTLRLAQVINIGTREQILGLGVNLQNLLAAAGVKDSDLKDGSLANGRIYCCHQATEVGTAMMFYVPPNVFVEIGDIVEVRMGRQATKNEPSAVNTVVRIREKMESPDSQCSWDPPNNTMWRRVLYCKWMPAEGWTLKNGLYNTWLKRSPDAKNQ